MEPRAFLRKLFRAKLVKRPEADHWSGGKPYHRGAKCPACKIPLLLLWDINCKDPRFPRAKFGPMERLPLYYCWGCVNDISYEVVDNSKINIHPGKRSQGPSFPYDPYPEFFERRGLNLFEGVPDEVRRAVLEMYASSDIPKSKDLKLLREFFGHPAPVPMCLFYHQFGGRPLQQLWANEVFQCPNPTCIGNPADRLHGRKRAMKFLAGILNDPWAGLPMGELANEKTKGHWDFFVSVQFHICDCCWTILGCNRY